MAVGHGHGAVCCVPAFAPCAVEQGTSRVGAVMHVWVPHDAVEVFAHASPSRFSTVPDELACFTLKD
jgi:hypothetical protein